MVTPQPEENLTVLGAGFTKIAIILLHDTDNLHMDLYIRFLSRAAQEGTASCTNIRLALIHPGTE